MIDGYRNIDGSMVQTYTNFYWTTNVDNTWVYENHYINIPITLLIQENKVKFSRDSPMYPLSVRSYFFQLKAVKIGLVNRIFIYTKSHFIFRYEILNKQLTFIYNGNS